MKELIGKTITALRVNEDQSILAFGHHDGTYTSYETCGDCCSQTWFADITGVPALLGAIVIGVEHMCLPGVEDGRTRQEHDKFYGVKLHTTKGVVDIVYRNSSNGYYGGDILVWPGPPPEGMTSITDDWSA